MNKKNQHVIPLGNGWAVKRAGSNRFTVITETKKKAVEVARKIAISNHSELVIYEKDGKVMDRESYEKNTCIPTAKKH